MNNNMIKTDILVVGGGMAGWLAADRARKAGCSVILADKGYIGKCGQSVYASGFFVYMPECGDDIDEIMHQVMRGGEYLVNPFWCRTEIEESHEMLKELESWGFEVDRNEDGSLKMDSRFGAFPLVNLVDTAKTPRAFHETFGYKARKHLEEIGVTLMDRFMVMELIKEDGRVRGAAGIRVESAEVVMIEAGAVIMCTGGGAFKPVGYSCAAPSTGDGNRMAYEAGASLAGKEFPQPMRAAAENPAILGGRGLPKGNGIGPAGAPGIVMKNTWKRNGKPFVQREEKIVRYPFSYLDLEFAEHAGNIPVKTVVEDKEYSVVTGAALGMTVRKSDGIWPEDMECRSCVPGLFAAGDALGTMQNGALYTMPGGSLMGCAATGSIAGKAAAAEVLAGTFAPVSEDTLIETEKKILAPLNASGGYSPRWTIQLIRNIMTPYFVSYIRKEDRLQAALVNIMFVREHIIPGLKAGDAHDLRLAYEAGSMALGAEQQLRSALFREESRGMHYREDYPFRDDENWLAWTKINPGADGMELEKVPVPEECRADADKPYEYRYPYRFPGEDVFMSGKDGE